MPYVSSRLTRRDSSVSDTARDSLTSDRANQPQTRRLQMTNAKKVLASTITMVRARGRSRAMGKRIYRLLACGAGLKQHPARRKRRRGFDANVAVQITSQPRAGAIPFAKPRVSGQNTWLSPCAPSQAAHQPNVLLERMKWRHFFMSQRSEMSVGPSLTGGKATTLGPGSISLSRFASESPKQKKRASGTCWRILATACA